MLKITFVVYGSIDQISGGYYYDRELINALEKRGHSVTICDARVPGRINFNTDIYIIDELCHPHFYMGRDFKRLKPGVPVAAMVHHLAADEDLNIFSRIRHLYMERAFFKRIDFAVFNSINTRSSVELRTGYNGPFVIAVPGKADGQILRKGFNDNPEKLSLLFLGNLIPRKGVHHILKNLSLIKNVPYRLVIAGDKRADIGYTRKIEKMISDLKLQANVEIKGHVSDKARDSLLTEADILLIPSSHEGFGIAYIEAMGYGTIPVAGISGGASEIINNGENGFLVRPESSSDLQAVLSILWEDPSRRKKSAATQ